MMPTTPTALKEATMTTMITDAHEITDTLLDLPDLSDEGDETLKEQFILSFADRPRRPALSFIEAQKKGEGVFWEFVYAYYEEVELWAASWYRGAAKAADKARAEKDGSMETAALRLAIFFLKYSHEYHAKKVRAGMKLGV